VSRAGTSRSGSGPGPGPAGRQGRARRAGAWWPSRLHGRAGTTSADSAHRHRNRGVRAPDSRPAGAPVESAPRDCATAAAHGPPN
jgi:hypothetical protein